GRPCVTGLKGISVHDDRVRCEREVPGGRDVYVVPLPAVLTVLEGLNLPRYPSVPGRLRAKGKPLARTEPTRPPSRLEEGRLGRRAARARREPLAVRCGRCRQ